MGRVFKEFADLKDLAIEVVKASLLFLKVCRALLSACRALLSVCRALLSV